MAGLQRSVPFKGIILYGRSRDSFSGRFFHLMLFISIGYLLSPALPQGGDPKKLDNVLSSKSA